MKKMRLYFIFLLFNLNGPAYSQNETLTQTYTITPVAKAHGSISPNSVQIVNSGDNLTFTANPEDTYKPLYWRLDGNLVQLGGLNYTLKNIQANHQIEVSFLNTKIYYAGGANGLVYFSFNNGATWSFTATPPNVKKSISQVWSTPSTLYANAAGSRLFFSKDNGTTWSTTKLSPDASLIRSMFITSNQVLYIATSAGQIFSSNDNGSSWTAVGKTPPGLPNYILVTPTSMYVGSSNGNVYYSNAGAAWTAINGSPDGSPIRSIFISNNLLYVNTSREFVYTSPNLTGGGKWLPFAQSTFSLFVSSDGNIIDAATQDGYVYSLNSGNGLGFISYTPINSLFVLP